jgi:hypothetical protein
MSREGILGEQIKSKKSIGWMSKLNLSTYRVVLLLDKML